MIGLVIQLGLIVILWAINRYVAKNAQSSEKKPAAQNPTFPRNDQAVPIPIFWGRVRIRGPIVIYARHYKTIPVKQSVNGDSVVIGYRYQLALQFLIGAPGKSVGPITTPQSKLTKVWFGERSAWAGELYKQTDYRLINKPNLFGGNGAGGGVFGLLHFHPGSFTQVNPDYLKLLLSRSGIPLQENDGVNEDIAYRGQAVVSMFAPQFDAGYGATVDGEKVAESFLLAHASTNNLVIQSPCGFHLGESAQLDGISMECFAPTYKTIATHFVGPISKEANPVCVIYDILVEPWDRVGRDPSTIDDDSFYAAAVQLATDAERNGFSMLLSTAVTSKEALGLVLEQIDGVLYDDVATGKVKLALIREDYDVGDLITLDPSNVLEVVSYSSGTWPNSYNQVRCTFTDRSQAYVDATATQQDQANFYATGAKIRSKDVHYPGCTTKWLADRLASRDLKALSLPLAKLRIAVNRDAYTLRPGDVFKFTWPDYNNMSEVVFRVVKYDLGKRGEERVILDCLQDRWAFKHNVFRSPADTGKQVLAPLPPTTVHRTESPLWLSGRAQLAGRVVDPHGGARMLYLPIPRSNSIAYTAEVKVETDEDFAQDIEPQPYPGRATVAVAYGRELEPFDNAVGLVIENVEDWTPTDASAADIALYGKNLILLVDDSDSDQPVEEFMTFETATDNGDGTWTLGNVGRGQLDTSPRSWAFGARVFSVHVASGAAVTRVGRVSFEAGQTHTSRLTTRGLGAVRDASINTAVDATEHTTQLRHALPYPVADLLVMCASPELGDSLSKQPGRLDEGGVDLTWKRRNRLSQTIIRGDAADEAPEADTTYMVIGRHYDPDTGKVDEVQSLLGNSLPYTAVDDENATLGAAGYGQLDIGVRASAPNRAANPAASRTAANLMDAVISIDAPHWRNLFVNGRFDQALEGWTTSSGQPQVVSDASSLGAHGYYLTGNVDENDVEVTQTQRIAGHGISNAGYIPGRLAALVHFYHFNTGDPADTVQVTVESLSNGGSPIDTYDSGVITPSTTEWTQESGVITSLDPGVASLRTTIHLGTIASDGAESAVTEVIVRVGQMSDQMLLNPDFATILPSVFTDWTNEDNSFVSDTTAPLYTGARYARPGNFATSAIYQDVTPPLGWEVNCTALMELARANFNADGDTGEVIMEARDSGGTVLADVTTGAEAISPANEWARRRLVLELPFGTDHVRVRLKGVRVSGGTCDTGFDNLRFYFLKHLDPDQVKECDCSTPVSQPVPPDYDYFDRAFPDVTPPTLGFYVGTGAEGVRGTEPHLETTSDAATAPATFGGKFVGAYDATQDGRVVHDAMDFPAGCDAGFAVHDNTFAAFTSSTDFTVLASPLKFASEESDKAYVVCGRVGTYGWEITLAADDSGLAVARLISDSGTYEATGTVPMADRAVRGIALVFDATAGELRLVTQAEEVITDVSAMGEIFDESGALFTIGAPTGNGGDYMRGQIAGVQLWDIAVPTADLQSMMTQGEPTTQALSLSMTRSVTGTLCSIVGRDDDGFVATRFGLEQMPFAYRDKLGDPELGGDGGSGYGFPFQLELINRITEEMQAQETGDWHDAGSATVTTKYGPTIEGNIDSFLVNGDNTGGRELRGITAGAAATKAIMFGARLPIAAPTSHTARVALNNAADVNKGNFDYTPTETWQWFFHVFSTWDNSTPTCRLRFCGSDDGTAREVEICGPFYLSESTPRPSMIPVSTDETAATGYDLIDVTPQTPFSETLNTEGEMQIVGIAEEETPFDTATLAQLYVASGTHDLHILYVDDSGKPTFFHQATDDSTSQAAAQSWDVVWTIRGRWNLAYLCDDDSVFAGVVFGNTLDDPKGYDRVAQWTPTGRILDTLQLGSSEIGDAMPCVIRSIIVRTRERRLASPAEI